MTPEPDSHTCCNCRALIRGRVLLEREALGKMIPLPGPPFLMERRVRLLPPREEMCEGMPAKVKEQPGPQLERERERERNGWTRARTANCSPFPALSQHK